MQHFRTLAVTAAAAAAVVTAGPALAASAAPAPTPNYPTYITNLYEGLLSRSPSSGDIDFWTKVADTQGRFALTNGIDGSVENAIDNVYENFNGYLDRDPTAAEVQTWAPQIVQARGDAEVSSYLLSTSEFFQYAILNPVGDSCPGESSDSVRQRALAGVTDSAANIQARLRGRTASSHQVVPQETTTVTTTPTDAPPKESATDIWLDYAYCTSLDRLPDAEGRAYFDSVLGKVSTVDGRYYVAHALKDSRENMESWAFGIYEAALGRAPESEAVQEYNVDQLINYYHFRTFEYFANVLGSDEAFNLIGVDHT